MTHPSLTTVHAAITHLQATGDQPQWLLADLLAEIAHAPADVPTAVMTAAKTLAGCYADPTPPAFAPVIAITARRRDADRAVAATSGDIA